MDKKDTHAPARDIDPIYAQFRIAKALTTNARNPDTRNKSAQWETVLEGILSRSLDIGSRTPVAGPPPWATLEAVAGSCVTGRLLAAGALLEHERALLAKLGPVPEAGARRALNAYHISEDGLARLQRKLHDGRYDIGVPEEGALLVVAWLAENGYAEQARSLIGELAPYFAEMRFYPGPTRHPRPFGSRVFLQGVGATISDLARIKPNQQILAQKEAIEIWAPLYDATVQLFLDTVQGERPHLLPEREGEPILIHEGRYRIQGGWPCRRYPEGWRERAWQLLERYRKQRAAYNRCGKPDRGKDSFAQLRKYLGRCLDDPKGLSGRDIGRIRLILARYLAKRGAPASIRCRALREYQRLQVSAPSFHKLARVAISRLGTCNKDQGLDDPGPVTKPLSPEEEKQWSIPAGTPIPPPLQAKIQRSLCDSVESLVARGVITSAGTLARVLPQMSSDVRAAGIAEPDLRRLHASVHQAFRRRRSLRPLNLESQVRLEDLPWVAAIDRIRREDVSAPEIALRTLREVAALTVQSFPHAVVPNKLVRELRTLAKSAGLNLPLVDELAAGIFTGRFSGEFTESARLAARLLQGTLYERYYDIDYQAVPGLADSGPGSRAGESVFIELCEIRAGVRHEGWDPAVNGMLIEQQQILTTQNLAALFEVPGLTPLVLDQLEDMARRCFAWICRRQQMKIDGRHARLRMLKNTAYAWRQMIFFLALLPREPVRDFLGWAGHHLGEQGRDFQTRFRPAFLGLTMAATGNPIDSPPARRFLGWSAKPHWLMA